MQKITIQDLTQVGKLPLNIPYWQMTQAIDELECTIEHYSFDKFQVKIYEQGGITCINQVTVDTFEHALEQVNLYFQNYGN